MTYLHPSWQLSATLTALLVAVWLPLRARGALPSVQAFAREFAIVMSLLGLWQYVGRLVRTHSAGAMARGVTIQRWQHTLHLPSERAVQNLVLGHPVLVQAMNGYYALAHLNSMGLFLVWVWWRHRNLDSGRTFRRVRNTVAASTLICLLVQLIPVAPPRLLPGYVDTALSYGQSVYGPYATGLAAQLTAMPSVHVGWAFIIAWYVAVLGRGPLRWLGVVHFVLTVLVVVATANHWWLDGAVAIAIALAVMAVQDAGRRLAGNLGQRRQKSNSSRPGLKPAAVTMSAASANRAPTR
jgi:hypothetical protein